MIVFIFGCAQAVPGGADTPEALQSGIAAALERREPWRVIDYVQPDDRDVFLAELDELASFAAITGGPPAFSELEAIDRRFGVPEHDWPLTRPVEHAATIERVYAAVSDSRGLAHALTDLEAKYAPKPIAIATPA